MPVDKLIKIRRDTAANWTSTNPVLSSGEAGYETDTGKLKYGNGSTVWTSLSYFTPQTSVTGNAGTATALQTARNIDGQAFDGTANITVIAPGTHAATSKTTPVDADELPLVDSAASNVLKRLTWANLKATLKTYFDTLYAVVAKGVTNGDTHDHNGGDGAQIDFLLLSNIPSTATNTNDIYRCDSCGTSGWSGTINGAPAGAVVTYTHVSGNKNTLVPTSTSQLGKIRLYNTTRGTNALISTSNGTTTITLTATAPAGWASGDAITTISTTVVPGGGNSAIDIEITSGDFTSKTMVFIYAFFYDSTATALAAAIHPLETYSAGKEQVLYTQKAATVIHLTTFLKLTGNVFSVYWNASGAATAIFGIREVAYIK